MADVEAGPVVKTVRKRKTTHNDPSHGSFFLRVGAIGESCVIAIPGRTRESTRTRISNSIRPGHNDLRGSGVRHVLRDAVHVAVPPDSARRESAAADDFHLHADVLYLHEFAGEWRIGCVRWLD